MLLGIDTGGTFTDFVLVTDAGDITIHKVLSTPAAPEQAILQGIRDLALDVNHVCIVHGSTVATNAVLEGKGARTAYITNQGLKDVLTIGRQARRQLYNLTPAVIPPPVPAELCLETGGRLAADGTVIDPLTDVDIAELLARIDELRPRAVAINLLYSFLDDRFERQISDHLPEDLFVSCSSAILPEQREYERGITTWLNAYVSPHMQGYLHRLASRVAPARLLVMRSTGQTCSADQAGNEAVHLLFSGPAGGLNGIQYVARQSGQRRLLTFDMGGTSTDVAMIDDVIGLTSQGTIAGYPVIVPMVDMHTIGAGGGSIASVDSGGVLQVGPESAGADPGPACYGQGGSRPTITDANLVLGRLPADTRLGGSMVLDTQRARDSLAPLVAPLGVDSIEAVAEGIIRVANEHMVQALRLISVQQGIDPRDFTLAAFGGAGGLHVCALAEALELYTALIPARAGVLSALGMLVAAPGRQLSRTVGKLLSECPLSSISSIFSELSDKARDALVAEGCVAEALQFTPSLDLCYCGQAFSLNIPWRDRDQVEADFHQRHHAQYGHRLSAPVELVNVRMGVDAPVRELNLQTPAPVPIPPWQPQPVYGIEGRVPVLQRDALEAGQQLTGPCILLDAVSTVLVAPGWTGQVDPIGNLLLSRIQD